MVRRIAVAVAALAVTAAVLGGPAPNTYHDVRGPSPTTYHDV